MLGNWTLHTIEGPQTNASPQDWQRLQAAHPGSVVIGQQYVNPRQAERYRELGIPYLDTAGNAWLDLAGLKIWVEGKPRPVETTPRTPLPRAFTRTGARLVFVLLVRDEYIKAPMRTLAKAAGISLGSVQQALQDLDHRGYLAGGVTGRTRLRRRDDLITQWTAAFANRLLPSLETRHAIGPVPTQWAQLLAGTNAGTIAGEANRQALIRPTSTTIYGRPSWAELTKLGKLRPTRDDGNIILREQFWDEDLLQLGTSAPALLDYAELVASGDPRQREVADELRDQGSI